MDSFHFRLSERISETNRLPEVKTFHALGYGALIEWADKGLIKPRSLAKEWELQAAAGWLASAAHQSLPEKIRSLVGQVTNMRDLTIAMLDTDAEPPLVDLTQPPKAILEKLDFMTNLQSSLAFGVKCKLLQWLNTEHKMTFRQMLTYPVVLAERLDGMLKCLWFGYVLINC
ncbi:MAG: hypothetical protein V7731_24210 [Amphritea sp.]